MLSPGAAAPAFKLADADMELVQSSKFRGKRNMVLYFYDKDNLPGSTVEAIEFSDLNEDFRRCNCEVLGVSPDDWMSHAEFRDKHGLSVRLLADPECEVCKSYDVVKASGVNGNGGGSEIVVCKRPHVLRSTFVIDRDGVVRHALYGVVNAKGHAQEVLKLVKSTLH
jgi:thioredoxin-dependent peroxiredoxin